MKFYQKIISIALCIPFSTVFAVDPQFLLETNSTNGNSIFIDSSTPTHTISTIGTPTHSTDQAYCGTSSMLLESGDAISINDSNLAFGNENFTIDFWLYPTDSGYDISRFYDSSHQIESFPFDTYDFSNLTNSWHHIAISKDSGTLRYYLDGVEKNSITEPSQPWNFSSGIFRFGSVDESLTNTLQYLAKGYVDNLRIFKGTALYNTQNFTPPTCNQYIIPTPTPTPTATPYNRDYDVLLALQVSEGVISVDIVNALGDIVETPKVLMSPISYKFDSQVTSGTLGTNSEKIRLSNPTGVSSWSVSIAASEGENAQWKDDQGHTINYNTTQTSMSINPSSGVITKVDGGEITGLSLGSQASFSQGNVSSITLFSANENAQSFSQFDLENIIIQQIIPPKQPSGNYEFNFTITAV